MTAEQQIKEAFAIFNLCLEMKYNPNHVPAGSEDGGQFTSAGMPNAVAVFQSTQFESINNELRYDKPDKYKDIIDELDKYSTDKTDDLLYRGLDSNYVKKIAADYGIKDTGSISELKSKLTNKIIHDNGFMSSSRLLSVAADFARDKGTGRTLVMQIEGRKTGIEVLRHVNNIRSRAEKEFVIKRRSSVFIRDVSLSKTGKIILYTQIL